MTAWQRVTSGRLVPWHSVCIPKGSQTRANGAIDVNRASRLVVLVLVAAVAGVPGGAPAAGAEVSVGITPSVVDLRVGAGTRQDRRLTISNEGDEAFSVGVAVSTLPGAPEARSAVPWLAVASPRLTLAAGAVAELTVTIAVPPGLASGGYYAAVTVTTERQEVTGPGAAVAGELVVPFLITVDGSGESTTQVVVDRFAAVLEPDGRTGFRAEVRNTGNTYVTLRGAVEVGVGRGPSTDEVAFRGPVLLLPAATAVLQGRSPLLLESGQTYRADAVLDFGALEPLELETAFTAEPPRATLRDVGVCTDRDGALVLGFVVRNRGSVGVLPEASVTLRGTAGATAEPVVAALPIAWPDDDTGYALSEPGRLDDGRYELALVVALGPATFLERVLSFQVGGDGPTTVRPCT